MRRGSVSPCDSPTARQSRFRGVRWLGAPLLRLPQGTRMTRAPRSAMKGPNRRPDEGRAAHLLNFPGTRLMDILYLLIPLSVVLVLLILSGLWWAVYHGQFESLDQEAERILRDG